MVNQRPVRIGPGRNDLRALFINCTLKPSPELSHTGGLIDVSRDIMIKQGVTVDVVRAVDHDIATGVWPDMTEHGAEASAVAVDAIRRKPGQHPEVDICAAWKDDEFGEYYIGEPKAAIRTWWILRRRPPGGSG